MSFEKFNEDMNIIAALDDEPNDRGGMTAAELKARFDKAGRLLKEYINGLVDRMADRSAAGNIGVTPFTGVTAANLQAALEALQANINGVQAGTVSDGSITTAKLDDLAVTVNKLAQGAVWADKLASSAVTTVKIKNKNVTAGKLADGAVETEKIADMAVTVAKLASDVLAYFYKVTDSIPATAISGTLSGSQIANSAVTGTKLSMNDGNLGWIKLTKNTHYFDRLEEAPTDAGRLVFVKVEE